MTRPNIVGWDRVGVGWGRVAAVVSWMRQRYVTQSQISWQRPEPNATQTWTFYGHTVYLWPDEGTSNVHTKRANANGSTGFQDKGWGVRRVQGVGYWPTRTHYRRHRCSRRRCLDVNCKWHCIQGCWRLILGGWRESLGFHRVCLHPHQNRKICTAKNSQENVNKTLPYFYCYPSSF